MFENLDLNLNLNQVQAVPQTASNSYTAKTNEELSGLLDKLFLNFEKQYEYRNDEDQSGED